MPRNVNQRLVDALVRHQVFLTGYARSVTNRIGSTLDKANDQMRRELLDSFVANDVEKPSLRRLRQVEAKLFGYRVPQWSAAREQFIDSIVDLLQYEPDFLGDTVRRVSSGLHLLRERPETEQLRKLVDRALIAGRTIPEVWKAIVNSDMARIIGATRIGYFAREAGRAIAARVVGTANALSPIVSQALGAVDTIVSTAVTAFANAARQLAVAANRSEFTALEIWISILDNRTTQGCFDLHLKIFEAGVGLQPGYHFHCRSDRVPMIQGEPAPPSKVESFADWVELQGARFSKFIGKMKTFNRKGIKPLTLSEVKRLDEETANDVE